MFWRVISRIRTFCKMFDSFFSGLFQIRLFLSCWNAYNITISSCNPYHVRTKRILLHWWWWLLIIMLHVWLLCVLFTNYKYYNLMQIYFLRFWLGIRSWFEWKKIWSRNFSSYCIYCHSSLYCEIHRKTSVIIKFGRGNGLPVWR